MKIIIEITDLLLEAAKKAAARNHTTVGALIELGLRHVLAEQQSARGFRLRNAAFQGEGLQPGVADASWERIRDLVYEGHGG